MSDPKVELCVVKEELALIEQQIEALLERQGALHDKKQQLETAIREAAATPVVDSTDWNRTDFEWSGRLVEAQRSVFKIPTFRPLQLSTMNATMAGRDCILIMPTGGGKSLCFQLPAVISKGVTLVVSPLLSLMEDQLMGLHELGITATLLNASSSREDVNSVHAAMTDKKSELRLLYVTPEKLAKSKRFMNKLEKMYAAGRFVRLVIDEVHCCSQWGHDFRPDYKFLGVMKRQFQGVPILGLTATATSEVVTDVKKILGVSSCVTFRSSFNRHNLYYEVRAKPASLTSTMDDIRDLIQSRFTGQSGIVYCVTRKDTQDVTRELQLRGIAAGCYHGDMDAHQRSSVHHQWMSNKTQVVVATIAFGMGIDKANVRFVIHHSMSKSMENYYQESGRAGRDDGVAHCILYVSFGDVFRQSTMVFTEQTGLDKLYAMVAYGYDASSCRRTLIARHFGELWDSANCNSMCDHCDSSVGGSVKKKDILLFCCDVVRLLEHAQATKQRVTPLKLVDAWLGKGATSLRLKTVNVPKHSRSDCERIVAYMLLHSYLREDFHFTPYSTISYLLPGSRASLLTSGGREVIMEFRCGSSKTGVSSSSSSSSSSSTKTSVSSSTTSSNKKTKPQLSVVNPEKSAFSSMLTKVATSPTQSKPEKKSRKRKPVIIESESDVDDDLAEMFEDVRKKKPKKSATLKPGSKSEQSECILLDSDDEAKSYSTSTIFPNKNGSSSLKTSNRSKTLTLNATKKTSDKVKGAVNKVKKKSKKSTSTGHSSVSKTSAGSDSDLESIMEVYKDQLGSVDRNSPVPGPSVNGFAASFESSGSRTVDGSVLRDITRDHREAKVSLESLCASEDEETEYERLQTIYAQQLSTLEDSNTR